MQKPFGRSLVVLAAIALLVLFQGCQQATVGATGSLNPGVGDQSFPSFDINNMPSVKYWNDLGGYEKLPNLFTFADGRSVQTLADWTGTAANNYHGRRWELAKIIQHYQLGYMPAFDASKLTITLDAKSTATSAILNFTYTAAAGAAPKTATLTVNASIPSGTPPTGGFPAIIEVGSGGASSFANARPAGANGAGYALIGLNVGSVADEGTHAGVVTQLYGYNYNTDLDAPSALMAWAWGAGRIIDALELATPAFGGKIDPKKLVVTGISRWGKGAMVVGAFAESQKGTQVAVTDIVSAGSLGPAIERFISPLGLHEQYSRTTSQTKNNIPGRTYYMKWIKDATPSRSLFASNTQDVKWFTSNHTDSSEPPYPAPFPIRTAADEPTSVVAITPADYALDTTHQNTFAYHPWSYEGIYNGNYWHGMQTFPELVNETPGWTSLRFKQFLDNHFGLGIDNVGGLPDRSPTGYFSTIPFDQHFVTALLAPRAVIIHEGYRTIRGNPEGQYLNHLAIDEVYKFFEEQDPTNYGAVTASNKRGPISQFNATKYYFITHSQPEYEMVDTIDLSDVYFGFKTREDIASARGSDYWPRFTSAVFPVTDPRSKHDYQRLDWARPGAIPLATTIANVPEYNWTKTTEWD